MPAEQLVDVLSCPICLELLKDPLIAAGCLQAVPEEYLLSPGVSTVPRAPCAGEPAPVRSATFAARTGVETGGG